MMNDYGYTGEVTPIRRKRRRNGCLWYFIFFILVFSTSLMFLKKAVQTYSPDVDVSLGSGEELILSTPVTDNDTGSVDERLKWIQMEDDIAETGFNTDINKIKIEKKETNKIESDNRKSVQQKEDIRLILPENRYTTEKTASQHKDTESKQKKQKKEEIEKNTTDKEDEISVTLTKVYIGSYKTREEAQKAQEELAAKVPSVSPFIKAKGDKYIVQAGSFYDGQKAEVLMQEIKSAGFSPKKHVEK